MAKKETKKPVKDVPTRKSAIPVADSKYEKVEMPPASSIDGLPAIMAQMAELKREEKAIKGELEALAAIAKALMEDVKSDESWSVRDDEDEGVVLTYMKPPARETIVRELLIQQGVTMKMIEKATKKTPITPYVQLRISRSSDE